MTSESAGRPRNRIYVVTSDEPAGDHDRRRTLLRDSVARAVAP
ncbi:hypothetical protein [Catenuloplanes atrovinosus]|uniref:Uncharacterized protein n=1 Tax=Catenuloplanes atrovinosus TaxID=137266 RepID=A0AAE3YR32_9ACTN|nr:hypothetical protein [Catenuloplanes atrovinosus]MDR7276216.1 hypothetical protein [Catenuloplanes atrovinosus]